MARATDSQMWNADTAAISRGLERRLLYSYLAAFAVALLVVGLAVRIAFITSLDRQAMSRLDTLARAGLRTAIFTGNRLTIDQNDISNSQLMAREQGLQWFDERGRLIGSEGLPPDLKTAPTDEHERLSAGALTLNATSLPIVNPRTGRVAGTIRATESERDASDDVRRLDAGLLIATILGLAASGVGGYALSRQAMRPIETSFRMLSEFTANAAHELRSPLTAIAANAAAALREEDAVDDPERARFGAIAEAANQMSRLTSDLLLLARSDGSLEWDLFVVDVSDLIGRVAAHYRPPFEAKGVGFSIGAAPALRTYGNPDEVERIVVNLVENALRYTRQGGAVSVDARQDRGHIVVSVRDNGIGIASKDLDRVFDRFWRADYARASGGTGLGLSIARALARRHGGDVAVSSQLGVGSEFAVSLPTRPPRTDT
jgi:signal transduction histidine kinase